ncbi:hypothetical protein PDIDSM_06070 [Penicillium digitatum]|nr:hypothetical protein PDIDSM_06070 [Penicillium digitatum]
MTSSRYSGPSCRDLDNTLRIDAGSCRGGFDFSLLFEETILEILPILLMLIIIPLRLWQLSQKRNKVVRSWLVLFKLAAWLGLLGLQIAQIALWALPAADSTKASVQANVILTIGVFALVLLSYAEHTRSVRPSFILNTYLFCSLLFGIARARTLWLRSVDTFNDTLAILATAVVGVKLLLFVLEAVEKRHILKPEYAGYPPEATAGFYNRAMFWWLNPLFKIGFTGVLRVEDLFVLDKELSSERLLARKIKIPQHPAMGVIKGCQMASTCWHPLPSLRRGIQLLQPLLLERSLSYSTRLSITVHKTLDTDSLAHTSWSIPDWRFNITLHPHDVERITQGWATMHEIWANSVEIALAIYLLKIQLGVSCVVPWLEAIEKRISSTSGMLGSIKGVKVLGLQDHFMKLVHGLRTSELDISKSFRTLLVYNMAFAWFTRIFAPIFTFGAYVGISSDPLSVSRAFTSLSLFSLLADPLMTLVMALMSFAGAVGSFQRIQQFLDKEDHADRRNNSHTVSHEDLAAKRALSKAKELDLSSINSDSVESLKRSITPTSSNAVVVQSGSFGWEAEKAPILSDITMTLPKGSFTVLVGPSGCGKSTLLKALLGEVPCSDGKVSVAFSSVAYCDQTPWHMNGTIKDSIVAMSEYDPQWYSSVIRACALEEDLAHFPRGDAAVIGSKGIALSGGQSQRIALARAVYARRKIMILDDALSGLDATTENHIFHSLFGPGGLLKEMKTCTIVASSSVKRLPYSDHIVVLDAGGRICEQGSFASLNKTGGYVASFGLGLPEWQQNPKRLSDSPSFSTIDTIQKEKEPLIEEPEHHDGGGDLGIYTYYINAIGWLPAIIFMVAMAGFVFCISFPSIWVKWWAQSDTAHHKQEFGHYLGIYAMLGCIALLALIVGSWQMIITMVPKSGESFHRALLTTVLGAPMLFFSTTDSGSILNRFSQDLQLIDMDLPIAAINTVVTFFLCLAQMALIGVSSKYAAISFPLVLGHLFLIQKVYLRTSRQLRYMDIEAKAPLYSHFTDCLQGLVTCAPLDGNTLFSDRAGCCPAWINPQCRLRCVALLNVIQFSQSIKLLVTFWTNLETHIGSIQRIKDFTSTVESEDKPGEDQDVPPNWPSKGAVAFHSVSAAYRPSEPVLNDVSLIVPAGEKVGICGRTGSGKTSMIMSIFRMMELTSGIITVDGVDISRLPRREIRSLINGVSQDSLLFKGSVRSNADPTGDHTDREILAALKSVQLLPAIQEKGALDTDVDEIHLSHGQKQLFCLARALLRPGNILILDEATSNIDSKTDEIMQRVIREKFCNHTILAVAHKLDTILDFDRIVVLDAGRIIENGEPYALLTEPKSHFSKLYASAMATEESD